MKRLLLCFILIALTFSCNNKEEWLVAEDEILDGGPEKDGIPSLDNPLFIDVSDAEYIQDPNALVLGFRSGDVLRAYPHDILDWHEIVNDEVDSNFVAISYCPLTGTGMAWNRQEGDDLNSYGVSGKLYNSNLILYDRISDSNWSQLLQKCINGSEIGNEPEPVWIIEMPWKEWKSMYPQSKVMSSETGHLRNYGFYPYGNYRTDHNLLYFPINNEDNRLSRKERVFTTFENGITKAYAFSAFGDKLSMINDQGLVLAGSTDHNFIVAYYPESTSGKPFELVLANEDLPALFEDTLGNKWDIFGFATEGPDAGARLKTVQGNMGYWFSFAAFYPEIQLYQ